MKMITLALILSLFSATALANEYVPNMSQLRADKAFVLKQEVKKLERMMSKVGKMNKTAKTECDPDVDIDIDIDTDSDGVDANCESRWSDGTCSRWGADQVGTCYPNCETRWSDGTCSRWGADICM